MLSTKVERGAIKHGKMIEKVIKLFLSSNKNNPGAGLNLRTIRKAVYPNSGGYKKYRNKVIIHWVRNSRSMPSLLRDYDANVVWTADYTNFSIIVQGQEKAAVTEDAILYILANKSGKWVPIGDVINELNADYDITRRDKFFLTLNALAKRKVIKIDMRTNSVMFEGEDPVLIKPEEEPPPASELRWDHEPGSVIFTERGTVRLATPEDDPDKVYGKITSQTPAGLYTVKRPDLSWGNFVLETPAIGEDKSQEELVIDEFAEKLYKLDEDIRQVTHDLGAIIDEYLASRG